ncbi:hypothetical protein [Evansella clarkii]|uniref:hypothetical protein n=1 Tax=Evansella clarkii TaxID=79879 RepID=UPI0009987E5F|nr:hypothetical protein [Evansella clarkii]
MREKKEYQLELVLNPEESGGLRHRLIIDDPEKYELMSRDRKKAYIEKMRREQQRMKDPRGPFVMAKNEPIRSLEVSELTVADRRYFMMLVLYAGFNGEALKKDGVPLTNERIADLWHLHVTKTKERLNKFTRIGLLEKIKDPRDKRVVNYVLNELYFQKGKTVTKPREKFVKLFQNKLSDVIHQVEKINELKNRHRKTKTSIHNVIGLLHGVMPYFHYEAYYLVSNPDEPITQEGETVLDALERHPRALKHLSKSRIGRILGYQNANRKTIDTYMDILQKAGAVMILKSKNKTRYIIHPDLMFRLDHDGSDKYTRHIRAMFEQHES